MSAVEVQIIDIDPSSPQARIIEKETVLEEKLKQPPQTINLERRCKNFLFAYRSWRSMCIYYR